MKTYFVNSMYCQDKDDELVACRGNTGNLVWHEKCKKTICFSEEVDLESIYEYDFSPEDVLVVPVANNFSPGETLFSKQLRKLQGINARVVLVGLGVQAPLSILESTALIDEYVNSISESKKRFFRAISQKCEFIGVRGKITADCLKRIGINNTYVIGCPSFYSGGEEKVEVKSYIKKIALNYSAKQSEVELLKMWKKNCDYIELFRQNLRDDIPCGERRRLFTNLNDWERELKYHNFDISVGTRLHGNMLAYLNNIPALWIVHDIRTYEVCETLKLPYIRLDDINCQMTVNDLASRCIYSENFYSHRHEMFKNYRMFLKKNGIDCCI